MPEYFAESSKIESPDDLQQAWEALEERADCSYFQSWGWIGQWLEHVACELETVLVKTWYGDLLVGIGIFAYRRLTRHHIIHSNAMFLNEYPFNSRNMVIEYNGLLADRDHQQKVYSETLKHLEKYFDKCDEFFFNGLKDKDYRLLREAHSHSTSHVKELEQSLTWSVELNQFEHGIDAFLKTLSKNRRAQLRRSINTYEKYGPLEIDEAGDADDALLYFDGLKALHTERWMLKGSTGSFVNPLWEQFHRSLISSRFKNGEVQLLRVSNAGEVIGYLYNFIWQKRVYVLQTGFKISKDKRLMPGYVSHVLAIVHNKQKGMAIYDLMHGDSLYKRLLCNQQQPLYWLVIQRNKFRFRIEDYASNLSRAFKAKSQNL